MISYRCYNMGAGNHIIGIQMFEALDDAAACIQARKFAKDLRWDRVELWELGRKIILP